MAEKAKNIGGLWKNETRDKKQKYLSGSVTISGKEYRITVWENTFKKPGEKSPDFRIFPALERQDEGVKTTTSAAPKTATPPVDPFAP